MFQTSSVTLYPSQRFNFKLISTSDKVVELNKIKGKTTFEKEKRLVGKNSEDQENIDPSLYKHETCHLDNAVEFLKILMI